MARPRRKHVEGERSEEAEIAHFNRYAARLKARMVRPFRDEFGRDQFAESDRLRAMSDAELRELLTGFVDDPEEGRGEIARSAIGALDSAAEQDG